MKNSAPKTTLVEPFEAEFSIKHSMFCFPTIYSTRRHVLNQYFLVIGTGMDWIDGGLAQEEWDDGDRYCTRKVAEMMRAGTSDEEIWQVVRAKDAKKFGEHNPIPDFEAIKKHSPELARDLEKIYKPVLPPKPKSFKDAYPMCEYSKLMTVPKNVRPDWWKLWKEALKLAKTVPVCGAGSDDAETARLTNKRQNEWIKKAEKRARDLGLYERYP